MLRQNLSNFLISLVIFVMLLSTLPFKGTAEEEQTQSNHENIRVIPAEDADVQYISTDPNKDSISLEKGEIAEERTENSKVYYNGNNSYTKKIYFEPIHIKENGEYKDISADLAPDKENSEFIETENTKLKSTFLSKMENGKYATFENNNHTLEFSILEASGNDVESIPVNDAEATFETENNKIVHKDIFPQVDLRNLTFNQNAKEDIILNNYNGYHKFKFNIKTDLKAVKTDRGSISLVDNQNKEIFNIPEPFMTDSNYDENSELAAHSENVNYELEKVDNGYNLIVDADSNWLEDPARKYPVFIDPNTSISITTDTYVSSANPNTNYSSASSKWDEALQKYVLYCGYYSSTTGTNYAYLINPIASINGLNITAATFYAYVMKDNNATATGLWLDRTDAPISPNSVTWANKPASSNIGVDTVSKGQWANYNVTSTVQSWANGSSSNYGFKLHTNGNDSTYWKKILSSANDTNKPYLSVNYSIPTPQSESFNNGNGTGFVNLKWNQVPDAIGYTVWIYNGKSYEAFDAGKNLEWSTRGQGIWPKTSTTEPTRYLLHHDGLGSELPVDPSKVYQNSGGSYSTEKHFWFRISARYSDSESNMSDVPSTPVIPLSTPVLSGTEYTNDDSTGYVNLSWEPIVGASGYKIGIFNGKDYQSFDVGNVTSWTTKGKGIWPTATEIDQGSYTLHTNGLGKDLSFDPSKVYLNADSTYGYENQYLFRISAYSNDGNISPFAGKVSTITIEEPDVVTNSYNDGTGLGYIDVNWEPVPGAIGYKVGIGTNGNYTYFDANNTTSWSSKNKKIWPMDSDYNAGNATIYQNGQGRELLLSPQFDFEIKLLAIYPNGNTRVSDEYWPEMPLSKIENVNLNATKLNDLSGYVDVSWDPIPNAQGYLVWIFNGKYFQSFDVGKQTIWSTQNKKIWPLNSEITAGKFKLHNDIQGTDLAYDPTTVYLNSGSQMADFNGYWIKVSAYDTNRKMTYLSDTQETSFQQETETMQAKQNEQTIQPFIKGDGEDAYEDSLIMLSGLWGDTKLYHWHQGTYPTPIESLRDHFRVHGNDNGIKKKTVKSYLYSAIGFSNSLKGARKVKDTNGKTPDSWKYIKGNKYIIMHKPTTTILTYGARDHQR